MSARDNIFHGSATILYNDVRADLTVFQLDRTGAVNVNSPVRSFNQILLQSAQEQDGEVTQTILSSDAPKIYSFGRAHRFFTYQAVLLDTNLDEPIDLGPRTSPNPWSGNSLTEWTDFYTNFARLSKCAQNRYIVRLQYANKDLYGSINQMTISGESTTPHKYDTVFSFYTVAMETTDVG